MDAQRWALEPETCRATGPLYQQLGPWNDVLIGRLLIALISTFFHVYIVWIHATQPAHPKMSLVPFRRRVLTVHIVSGSLEILVSLGSWFVVNCALAGRIHALLAVVHTCTALVQVQGGLFGMQLVMIPGYVLACLIKLTLAVLLALSPCCYGTSLALYLAHATYAWVRVLHNRFIYLHIFIGSEYTVAIIAAGVICGAAVSELYPFVLFALVGAYIIAARRFLSKEEFAYQQCENSRRLEDAFVDVGGGDRARRLETNLRNQFAKADTDGSGYLSHAEVMAMGSATFADLIKLRTSGDMREMNKVSVEDVIGLVQGHSRLLDANLKHDATEETQSQAIFDALDIDGSGGISTAELSLVLRHYGLPLKQVAEVMKAYDSNEDNVIDYKEFHDSFRPFWLYIYRDLLEDREWTQAQAVIRRHRTRAIMTEEPSLWNVEAASPDIDCGKKVKKTFFASVRDMFRGRPAALLR